MAVSMRCMSLAMLLLVALSSLVNVYGVADVTSTTMQQNFSKSEVTKTTPSSTKQSTPLDMPGTGEEKINSTKVPRCQQDPEPGICRAMIPAWYYNYSSNRCQKFNYGGCRGNDNRFNTIKECLFSCPEEVRCPEDSSKTCSMSQSACSNATCPGKKNAICRLAPCTCQVYFVNMWGNQVFCEGEERLTTEAPTTVSTSTTTTTTTTTTADGDSGKHGVEGEESEWAVMYVLLVVVVVAIVGVIALLWNLRSNKWRRHQDRDYFPSSGAGEATSELFLPSGELRKSSVSSRQTLTGGNTVTLYG